LAARVFVSYRRSDSETATGRLVEHLDERLGPENVFRDVGSIDPGRDFTEALAENLGHCSTGLVVIGGSWLAAADERGGRRLDDPEDWVRREVAALLERKIRVIPVLLDDTPMPRASELPEPLRALARRQAVKLRPDPDFKNDVELLLRHVPGVNPPVFIYNLALTVLLFALVAFWVLRYSSWKGSILAGTLAGCATLAVVLFRLLPEHRARAVRGWIDGRYFLNPRATVALGVLALLAALASTFFGGVRILTPASSPYTSVAISDTEHPGRYSLLEPGERREVFWTLPWSRRALTVFVKGLPAAHVELSPWELETLTVPSDFLLPAVLVYCDSRFLAETAKHPPSGRDLRCNVTLAGEPLGEFPWKGQSFYVGCGLEVGLPASVRAAWDELLQGREPDPARRAELESLWETLAPGPPVRLAGGEELVVEIRNYTNPQADEFTAVGRGSAVVEDPAQSGHFPQILPLKIL